MASLALVLLVPVAVLMVLLVRLLLRVLALLHWRRAARSGNIGSHFFGARSRAAFSGVGRGSGLSGVTRIVVREIAVRVICRHVSGWRTAEWAVPTAASRTPAIAHAPRGMEGLWYGLRPTPSLRWKVVVRCLVYVGLRHFTRIAPVTRAASVRCVPSGDGIGAPCAVRAASICFSEWRGALTYAIRRNTAPGWVLTDALVLSSVSGERSASVQRKPFGVLLTAAVTRRH
jgi:hypothetical protein